MQQAAVAAFALLAWLLQRQWVFGLYLLLVQSLQPSGWLCELLSLLLVLLLPLLLLLQLPMLPADR
jgi:hypothetical protein